MTGAREQIRTGWGPRRRGRARCRARPRGSRWRAPPTRGILRRGRSAPESRVPPRYTRRGPVPARHVASRIGHHRLQPLEWRGVHGVHASRPHRLRRTHRTPGALAFPAGGPTPRSGGGPDTAGNDGSTANLAPTKIGGRCRRNGTFPAAWEERRPTANTGPLTH
jgi:hypothetical protein